jgi:hypothetical protein
LRVLLRLALAVSHSLRPERAGSLAAGKQTPRGLTLLSMVEPDWRRRLWQYTVSLGARS